MSLAEEIMEISSKIKLKKDALFGMEATDDELAADIEVIRFARRAAGLLHGFMLDTNAIGERAAGVNLARSIKEALKADAATLAAAQPVASCEYCDNTGDVHSVTGEWRGTCTECTPAAEADAEVMLTAFDEACKNSEGRRVSWHGYTEGQRLDVIRRAMLAAANKENNP